MTLRRRETLALTGAFLAGLAGCAGSEVPDSGVTTDETTDRITTVEATRETTESGETTTEESPGFDDLDAPPFPELDPTTDPQLTEDLLADQIRGNVGFALDLLAVLREQEDDPNLFASPYSVSVALAMTYAGARGDTAAEMADALRYGLDGEYLHAAFGSLETEFERRNEDGKEASGMADPDREADAGPAFELSTANAAWGQEGYPFREDFLDLLDAYYFAGLNLVDFAGDAEAARAEINDWVAERTNDRIEDLLPETSVDGTTKLVLTNAVYFSARWRFPFDEANTESRSFTALDGTAEAVPTMYQSTKLPYAEVDGHRLVELPYANGDTSMVVVLPAEGEFEAFEESLTVDRLAIMLERASTALVDLSLPKFGVESAFRLVETMEALGMNRAFGGGADFSGLVEGGGLFVDDIVHESFVEVDELGTEAAAATAVAMAESMPPRHVEVTVDRPFLFYVRDRPTETPLFVGRVTNLAE